MTAAAGGTTVLAQAGALAAGLLFGLGLIAGGMTDPAKVLAFLDLAGAWDPSLALVMAAAIAVARPAFGWAGRHARTLDGQPLHPPLAKGVDARLLGGGLLFGAGWGLVGLCPGPALAALATGLPGAWMFVLAMLAGIAAVDLWEARR